MTYGSIVAILCALFVIFFIPYMEKKDKKEITLVSGLLAYKGAVRHFLIENNFTALCTLLINYCKLNNK